jgi:hypothetical protein
MSIRNLWGSRFAYDMALNRGKKTPTGRAILVFLEQGNRLFDVVVLRNGSVYGQMMIEDDPPGEETERARDEYFIYMRTRSLPKNPYIPTVFWCPDYTFVYYGDVSGIGMLDDGTVFPKKLADLVAGDFFYTYQPTPAAFVDVPVVRYTRSEMAPWAVLFHELGHVKQFYSGLPATWLLRLRDTAEIEAENLAQHENPMCLEADIAIRAHYKHMENGFVFIAGTYAFPAKKPALRISSSRQQRIKDDLELAQLVKHHNTAGFFQLKSATWAQRNKQSPRSAW